MSAHYPQRVYFHHSPKPVSQPQKLAADHLRKNCSIPCKKGCSRNIKRLERYLCLRKKILAESLPNRVNAAPPDAQLHASVVYTHFCFSVEQ